MNEKKVLADASQTAEKALEFLSTHPDTQSRIDHIESMVAALNPEQKDKLVTDVPTFALLKQRLSALQP